VILPGVNIQSFIPPPFPFSLVSVVVDELGFPDLFDARYDHKLLVRILVHTLALRYSARADRYDTLFGIFCAWIGCREGASNSRNIVFKYLYQELTMVE
jgi:hypothetical protein